MTAPSGFGQSAVLPMLPRLLEGNPELRIDLDLSDRQVDIVGQGLDLALRVAPLEDSELVARKIGPNLASFVQRQRIWRSADVLRRSPIWTITPVSG
jgi:DNA-binding transcriptional LysR family regulator